MRPFVSCVCAHIFILSLPFAGALEYSVRVTPLVTIPVGSAVTPYFSAGGGAALNPSVELLDLISVGPELGFYITPLMNAGSYPSIVAGGIASGIQFYPLSRLRTHLGVSGGVYEVTHGDYSYSDLWWKVYGDAGIRLSPTLTLGAGAGFVRFAASEAPLYDGVLLGIGLQHSFSSRRGDGNVTAVLEQYEPLFPLLYRVYSTTSIGTATVRNEESAEVRNLSLHFRAENYTAALIPTGAAPRLRRNESITFPVHAEFSERLQDFTEDGVIRGELVIRYELLGMERVAHQTVTLSVYNRNSVRWSDPAVLASFISPNSPEVLDYSRYIVGFARNHLRSGLNQNMQFAMFLLEGLTVGGMRHSNDDTTPYRIYRNNPERLDYIQYPFETLSYRMGDYDDLGILYAAVLESVGIRTAMIPLADDFIVAFSLDIDGRQAEALFSDTDRLLTIDNEIWMPLSFSAMREGFVNSWAAAIGSLDTAIARGENVELVVTKDAWVDYPPSGIRGRQVEFPKPSEVAVERAVELNMLRYIATQFGPRIREIERRIQTSGGSVSLHNQLGLLYVRAGLYDDARSQLLEATAMGSVTAMVNLGNIDLLERNYDAARTWFERVLDRQPNNGTALNGIRRIESRFERRGFP